MEVTSVPVAQGWSVLTDDTPEDLLTLRAHGGYGVEKLLGH